MHTAAGTRIGAVSAAGGVARAREAAAGGEAAVVGVVDKVAGQAGWSAGHVSGR